MITADQVKILVKKLKLKVMPRSSLKTTNDMQAAKRLSLKTISRDTQ